MYVLKHPLHISRGANAQIGIHAIVPGWWQVFCINLAPEQGRFQFKTNHDVQIVGDFISFDANKGVFDSIDGAIKVIERNITQCIRKRLLRCGEVVLPEPSTPTHQIFP